MICKVPVSFVQPEAVPQSAKQRRGSLQASCRAYARRPQTAKIILQVLLQLGCSQLGSVFSGILPSTSRRADDGFPIED